MTAEGVGPRDRVAADLVHDAPCGIAVTDPDGRLQYVNSTLERWLGREATELLSLRLTDLFTPALRLFYETHMAPMMRLQGHVREISCRLQVAGGPPRPVLLSGVGRFDAAGAATRFDYTIFDARERHRYEEELRNATREADELAAIVRSSPNAILRTDPAGRITNWNPGAERQFGHPASSVLERAVADVIPFEGMTDWFRQARDARAETTFEARYATGSEFEVTLAPIFRRDQPHARPDWSVVLRDVTERKAAERRLEVMVGEMRHRVNNVLTMVSGIARQTLPVDHGQVFIARLQALAQANDALSRSEWTGAGLRQLLDFAKREAGGGDRFRYAAPDIELSARQATALSMALHEMVTNALKYGALSRPAGQVEVRCDWEGQGPERRLRIGWVECGGPEVSPPTREGFGTRMIRLVLGMDLGGEVRFDYPREGFRCQIVLIPGDRSSG
ncbi:PAS domain S-box protein [Rhodobacteraceae bacterium 2CG4]|uniref:histidine kinase n=1 Tax=Halovulum marinum TaxID=2662447 RepID=A0A6L5Z2E3_9RHOB|nr:PAS domain S-box protein [Halovulum marinum]MSU90751.1 PAS domain S-box protein [Halovulum marinum]